jgi:hypothetical protein
MRSPTGDTDPAVAAPREVAEVRWVDLDELEQLMPDLYQPAREQLAALLRQRHTTRRPMSPARRIRRPG